MAEWIITDDTGSELLDRAELVGGVEGPPVEPITAPIALRLHDIVVHDTKKWSSILGGARIRVDVLVVQGNVLEGEPASFYTPTTVRFDNISDEQRLPLDSSGLLAYFGWPKHFLDISVLVSRDTKKSDDLKELLAARAADPAMAEGLATVQQLVASGGGFAVSSALSAAATLGSFAYDVVRAVCDTTIGVYRGNRLEHPQRFGMGLNPQDGRSYRQNDMSLRFEVVTAGATASTSP